MQDHHQPAPHASRPVPQAGPPVRSVLVVEDDPLVALSVEEALAEAGFRLCGSTASPAEALRLAERDPPAFAVVDITLGPSRSGLELGRTLARHGVQVLYASAYGLGLRQEMEDMGGRACLQKPYAPEDVPRALGALERLARGEPPRRLPPSFHLFVD